MKFVVFGQRLVQAMHMVYKKLTFPSNAWELNIISEIVLRRQHSVKSLFSVVAAEGWKMLRRAKLDGWGDSSGTFRIYFIDELKKGLGHRCTNKSRTGAVPPRNRKTGNKQNKQKFKCKW